MKYRVKKIINDYGITEYIPQCKCFFWWTKVSGPLPYETKDNNYMWIHTTPVCTTLDEAKKIIEWDKSGKTIVYNECKIETLIDGSIAAHLPDNKFNIFDDIDSAKECVDRKMRSLERERARKLEMERRRKMVEIIEIE